MNNSFTALAITTPINMSNLPCPQILLLSNKLTFKQATIIPTLKNLRSTLSCVGSPEIIIIDWRLDPPALPGAMLHLHFRFPLAYFVILTEDKVSFPDMVIFNDRTLIEELPKTLRQANLNSWKQHFAGRT